MPLSRSRGHLPTFLCSLTIALVGLWSRPAITSAQAPALPKVLIIGDSISLGYTEPVKALLKERADVRRPKENCQHSANGVKKIDAWLGQEKWDVIHFNFGIWDTHMLDATGALVRDETGKTGLRLRHTPEQYRENLAAILKKMQATKATIVFANTTPIMRYKGSRYEDLTKLNTVAAELMKSNDVAVNDLHSLVLPNAQEWQTADKVHFNKLGNEHLAKQVADSISAALERREKAK
ncbi:hypothetical protein ETAA8_31990 [Anatilimnocola aggregata]|uniref:SGNH hydrolase-type esterase domain-containing protein n=1 Tax=Anatilimnocola aggregata TaxID=2528021 RepID=A0A517YCY7_9BACT|nr:SGNH/GDSL hydrolase family protein [Anatilimnocola aggregata]QDU28106.1 hypothetical protein ETAA8_31990 [Anatilimnocola aggregata]